MNRISTWLTTLALLACSVAANATMTSIDGGALVNDSTDNLTWVADADLFATMAAASGNPANFVQTIINNSGGIIHDTPNADDYPAPNSGSYALSTSDFTPTTTRLNNAGAMTWFGAMAWVNYLNVTKYQGYSEWRLPTTIDASSSTGNPSGGAGNPPVTSSELAELFYGQLGQVTNQPILTTHNGNYSLFSNMQDYAYWSGTENAAAPSNAWNYSNDGGLQQPYDKFLSEDMAMVVRSGQATTVPLPNAAWLMLSGLSGLALIGRRRLWPQ